MHTARSYLFSGAQEAVEAARYLGKVAHLPAVIGKNIRFYRLIKHLTQEDLAEMAGYTPNYIGMIERGERILPLKTFITLVNILDVSADMILADLLTNRYKLRESRCLDRLASMFSMTEKATVETLEALVTAYEAFIKYPNTKSGR